MKKITYQDEQGRTIEKKEGFSWITFWLLMPFTLGIGSYIYAVSKGGFNAVRGTSRAVQKNYKKNNKNQELKKENNTSKK